MDGQFTPFDGLIPFLGTHPKERLGNVVNSYTRDARHNVI